MKKQFAIIAFLGVLATSTLFAQDSTPADSTQQPAATQEVAAQPAEEAAAPVEEERSFHQSIKDNFIQGGVPFMWPILICMILGLAVAIERIITLNMATTNTKKLLGQIEDALAKGGVNAALDVTRNTRGPVASIFTQGLMRYSEGVDMVEKSIVSYSGI